jgi:hypothetical protein
VGWLVRLDRLVRLVGHRVGFSPWCVRQLGTRLAMFLCFGFLGDQMGFRVGPLVGVEVGLRHLGKQLGSRVGVDGSGTVG